MLRGPLMYLAYVFHNWFSCSSFAGAFCLSTWSKVCFHTTIFTLDHNTFYISLFFICEVILYVHLNPLHLPRCLIILRLCRDINLGDRVQDGSSIRHINISFVLVKNRWNTIGYLFIIKKSTYFHYCALDATWFMSMKCTCIFNVKIWQPSGCGLSFP